MLLDSRVDTDGDEHPPPHQYRGPRCQVQTPRMTAPCPLIVIVFRHPSTALTSANRSRRAPAVTSLLYLYLVPGILLLYLTSGRVPVILVFLTFPHRLVVAMRSVNKQCLLYSRFPSLVTHKRKSSNRTFNTFSLILKTNLNDIL